MLTYGERIISPSNDLVLDLQNGDDDSGVRVVLAQDTGAPTQQWQLQQVSNY